ncbi:small nuclear ribonucleoprotein E-like protein [Tanacetum coccineum]
MATKNLIFRFLQTKTRIQIWLFQQKDLRIEGRIIGFDEYMNLVLDEAEEVSIKKKKKPTRKQLGRILLKGDNIALMMNSYGKVRSSVYEDRTQAIGEWTIHPWFHSNCNSLLDADQLRPVPIPDIHPASCKLKIEDVRQIDDNMPYNIIRIP